MPLIFSAAESDRGLIYWAFIDDIAVDEGRTTCRYSSLQSIREKKGLSTLRLKSSGRPMSDDYIRPYAICHTPHFIASGH
jgi:hypothetical protein